MKHRRLLASSLALAASLAACTGRQAPSPSHVSTPYRMKVDDDTLWEASSVPLVTTKDVVISANCGIVIAAENVPGAVDRLVARGMAARLPANVTVYTTPDEPLGGDAHPQIITDDRYAGRICTAQGFAAIKKS